MNVWVIMHDDEFVGVAASEVAAKGHAAALVAAKLADGYYGDAEQSRWDGHDLQYSGTSFGQWGWHPTGYSLTETELIGRPDLPEVEAPGPLRVMSSTMCSCGDLMPAAELGSDNLFVPHVDARTGERCRGLPIRGVGGAGTASAGFDSLPAGNGATPEGGSHFPPVAPASDPVPVYTGDRADVARTVDVAEETVALARPAPTSWTNDPAWEPTQ